MLLFSPNHHNCSYDHLNCSFFSNQVIFKGLSVFYSDSICPSKSKTVLPFCSYAANPKKSQENCPQYRNNSSFYFPCACMPYNNTVLASPSFSKIIVLIILMNKQYLRTAKKGNQGNILAKFQLFSTSCKPYLDHVFIHLANTIGWSHTVTCGFIYSSSFLIMNIPIVPCVADPNSNST